MYTHTEYIDAKNIGDNPFVSFCPYCNSRLLKTEVEDCWPVSDNEVNDAHAVTIEAYKQIHDLEDCYLELDLKTQDIVVEVHYCWTCGWWRLIKNICVCAREWQIWDISFGCVGALKKLDLADINEPLIEVRNFLVKHYDKRFYISPRVFQDVTADVFKSLGYHVQARSYTDDGGVDIVLTNENGQIGVQVKRSKNSIQLEQIRAFVGALLLDEIPGGIYITTSSFQPGANKIIHQSARAGKPIKLLDASAFYEALKIAQIRDRYTALLPFDLNSETIPSIHYYGWDTPRNSL